MSHNAADDTTTGTAGQGAAAPHTATAAAATVLAAQGERDLGDLLRIARYGERLHARQARLYRKAHLVGAWVSVMGATATVGTVAATLPHSAQITCSAIAAGLTTAITLLRAGDKAHANEAAQRRYSALAAATDVHTLHADLASVSTSDPPEIEALRSVVYNDVVRENGTPEAAVPLNAWQRLLACLA